MKNLEVNVDEWKPGNPLWITGSSGDGKSTLAKQIVEKNNAVIIASDIILCRMGWKKEKFDDALNGILNEQAKVHKIDFNDSPALDYVLHHPELPYDQKNPETHSFIPEITDPEMIKFYQWLIKELKENEKYNNKLYLIEGCDICLMDPDIMIEKPLIIVGCSRLRSFFRRAKRDSAEKNRSIFKSMLKYIKKYKYQSKRLDDAKSHFRKEIKKRIK